jgi:hypothetical protein
MSMLCSCDNDIRDCGEEGKRRLTQFSTAFIQELTVAKIIKKFPASYGIRRFTKARPFPYSKPDESTCLLPHIGYYLEFEVLTAVSTQMAVFWVVVPCSLVDVYRRFRDTCCLHHQGDEL